MARHSLGHCSLSLSLSLSPPPHYLSGVVITSFLPVADSCMSKRFSESQLQVELALDKSRKLNRGMQCKALITQVRRSYKPKDPHTLYTP